jgi:hypothetical protein
LIDVCKKFYRRYNDSDNFISSTKLVLLNHDDADLKSTVVELKGKMKGGFVVIKISSLKEDISINQLMVENGYSLKNRIILPLPKVESKDTLKDGYESLLVFSLG